MNRGPATANRMVRIGAATLGAIAAGRLAVSPSAWAGALVLSALSAYCFWQVYAFFTGNKMMSHYGTTIPADTEHQLERKCYAVVHGGTLAAIAIVFITGTHLFSGKPL